MTNDRSRIKGAKACLQALRHAVEAHNAASIAETVAETMARKDAVTSQIMAIAGSVPPRAAGVIGLLVELANDSLENGYTVGEQVRFDGWEATMSDRQVGVSRAEFAASVEAAT
ncbi:MAG: hypothetical protein EG825_07330 [Rhodocyclaceae bacterium]|nr:hypothetical protein [Rhodocyclaceae bacterium]